MTIEVEFEDEATIQRIVYLVSNEIATLTGLYVLAGRRVDAGRNACTSKQFERAKRALRSLPEQLALMEVAKDDLLDSLDEIRKERRGNG